MGQLRDIKMLGRRRGALLLLSLMSCAAMVAADPAPKNWRMVPHDQPKFELVMQLVVTCTSPGITIDTEAFADPDFDTVIVAAATEVKPSSPGLLEFVRQALPTSRRVAALCTGAFVLAEAGILDGRRATTHWAFARDLRERYPKVKVEPDGSSSLTAPCGPPRGCLPVSTLRWR